MEQLFQEHNQEGAGCASTSLLQSALPGRELSTEAMLCCSFIPEAGHVRAEAVLCVMLRLPLTHSQAQKHLRLKIGTVLDRTGLSAAAWSPGGSLEGELRVLHSPVNPQC